MLHEVTLESLRNVLLVVTAEKVQFRFDTANTVCFLLMAWASSVREKDWRSRKRLARAGRGRRASRSDRARPLSACMRT
jgi:hypothetical protein